jgi:hypothetical protein
MLAKHTSKYSRTLGAHYSKTPAKTQIMSKPKPLQGPFKEP